MATKKPFPAFLKKGAAKSGDKEAAAEMSFMKKNKAPKSMMAAEAKEESAEPMMKKGGTVKKYAKGGGIESKGKTRGRMV